MHIIPRVAAIIAKVMVEEFGIYKTRIPKELFPIEERSFNAFQIKFYNEVVEQAE